MDFASHRQFRESVLMLKLMAQSEVDVRAGKTIAQSKVFSDLRTRLEPMTTRRFEVRSNHR